ncbi:phage tail protein [Pseudomonas sp. NPDC098740]|uniref:phage tail protein n=1 Tax=Pseudomonas sp. NPDC098740 TaxID=3364486 RepID=UPI00383A6B7A
MIDANSQFFAILTNVGMAKQANADALGIPWKLTEMGVGDANGTDPIPSAAQTSLISEWRRRPLNQLKVDPLNSAVIIAEQVIPADEGGKWIREIGLYDADGDLVAVANCAPSFKPVLSQGSGRTQVVRMNFIVSSTGNITLKIDPSVVLATREYVDSKILEELNKLDSKQSVLVATTANIALAGLHVIDGVSVPAGARVLVKNQAVAKDNGIWIAAAPAWTRALDADTNAEVTSALVVSVEQGTTLADTRWQLVTDGVIVLGATALTFQDVTQGYAPINSPALLGTPTAPTQPQFDKSLKLVNSAFLKRAGVEYSIFNSISATTVLTSTSIGGEVSASSATPINVTLPPTVGVPDGATVEVVNAGSGAVTILASGGDTLTAQSGGVVPVVLALGDNAYFIKVSSEWRLRGGSISLKYAAIFAGANWTTPPLFDNTQKIATTEFVQRSKGSYSDYLELAANTVLTPADVGKIIKASAVDITLPALASVPNGATITVRTGQGGRLLVQGADQLLSQVGALPTPYVVVLPQVFQITKVGTVWQILSGDGALPSSALFYALLASNGYLRQPSGLIIQLATIATAANGLATITHPIAFPTAKLKVLVSVAGSTGTYAATWDDVADAAGTPLTATRVRATLAGAVSTANVQALIIGC